ncbi:MAG: hypothetical protein EBW98_04710, partial [Actinobacteria bacterium]|nr:hypothetical protein [Actinomycetota bacterium]
MINLAFIEGDFAYSLLLGMLAAVNPCGFVLLPTYLIAYLSVADESPTHVRVRRALTVGGSVSLGFLGVFLVVGVVSRLFTAWIEMNAKYAALIIGIALIVLGVRMLRGWKPRLWVPALSGNAGSRGVRSMAAFGVVYAVASIGCTLGLLTTAVLGSFARHGVVSGVASVAMYGLGMGVFVTALTVTLAFTKSGLLRASRTVMKVLDRVSSALVIFTGIYLTPGGIISRVGDVQNAVVTAIADVGAISIFFFSLLVLIMANQSWRLSIASILRGSASDIGIGTLLLASVTLMLLMSKQLITVTDFKMYLLGFERVRSAGELLPGSIGDFSRSLGISEYPGSLLFNLPWLLATSVPDSLTVLIYGVAATAALYGCVIGLGRTLALPAVVRQSAGILLPFVIFVPGPLMWNGVARYDPAFTWLVAVTGLAVLPIAELSKFTRRRLSLMGLVGGCFIFLSNIQFLPTIGLVVASVLLLTFKTSRRSNAHKKH